MNVVAVETAALEAVAAAADQNAAIVRAAGGDGRLAADLDEFAELCRRAADGTLSTVPPPLALVAGGRL